ncbi:MAG: hypothetical protein DI565_03025 [Ancylobacter novellus]|uniref:Secreted protein n=1 Tax=Ancylobacter novellus TaxID=921 RepID=A0A2W5MVN8_ANCNO|nr:MAG: hypothetical protein DI565_03025 [Ancylobacter novellus]
MAMTRRLATAPLAALVLAAGVGLAAAAGPERGAGSSGAGDGSGMGQDNSELGTPKGPGDKATDRPASGEPTPVERRMEGTSPEGPGMIGRCDDGRTPVDGACPR